MSLSSLEIGLLEAVFSLSLFRLWITSLVVMSAIAAASIVLNMVFIFRQNDSFFCSRMPEYQMLYDIDELEEFNKHEVNEEFGDI